MLKMTNEEQIIKLLTEIKALLTTLMSEEYINQQDIKQFCINITADVFVEMMNKDKKFKEKIMNNFKNM